MKLSSFKKKSAALVAATLASCVFGASSAQAFWGLGYTNTEHPIVLVHGFIGFDDVGGAVQYFNGIPAALSSGGADVHVVQVSAGNSSEVRGEQLLAQVEEIVAATGADKVNLIAHSQGSPDSRYVAAVRPDLVASVSSVGGANWGTPLADVIEDVNNPLSIALSEAFFSFVDLISEGGFPQDAEGALDTLTTEGAIAFNQQYPAGLPSEYCGDDGQEVVNGVRYYSWGGNAIFTNIADISDGFFATTSLAFDEPTDGIIASCSQKLGRVLNVEYNMNHADEVNQVLGLTAVFSPDPVSLFRQQANRLKRAGL